MRRSLRCCMTPARIAVARRISPRFASGSVRTSPGSCVPAATRCLRVARWKTRKDAYLAHLDGQPEGVLLVSLADKLFNARAILRDYRSVGDSLWRRFSAGRDGVLWYYRSLSDSFTRIVPGNPMTGDLAEVVTELERLVAERSTDSPPHTHL